MSQEQQFDKRGVEHRWSGPYHDRLEYLIDGRVLTMEEVKGHLNYAICMLSHALPKPLSVKAAFTLGGAGSATCSANDELLSAIQTALAASPIRQIQIEEAETTPSTKRQFYCAGDGCKEQCAGCKWSDEAPSGARGEQIKSANQYRDACNDVRVAIRYADDSEEDRPATELENALFASSATLEIEALKKIASKIPRKEDSIHGPRMRCYHCGHAWRLDWNNGAGEPEHHEADCAYIIALRAADGTVKT